MLDALLSRALGVKPLLCQTCQRAHFQRLCHNTTNKTVSPCLPLPLQLLRLFCNQLAEVGSALCRSRSLCWTYSHQNRGVSSLCTQK
jgi:hypothetical protein